MHCQPSQGQDWGALGSRVTAPGLWGSLWGRRARRSLPGSNRMGSASPSFCHPLHPPPPAEWDIDTGKCLKTFRHKDPILATRINDTYIVSSCEKGTVKVWQVATAQLLKVRGQGHPQPTLELLSYSPQEGGPGKGKGRPPKKGLC